MSHRIRNLHQRIYAWRQRRPVKRFCTAVLLLVVFPFRFAILSLLNIFSRGQQPSRIVVIQFAGLGDALMLTPALAAIQDRYPVAQIDFITLHGYVKDAFQQHPRLRDISILPAYPGHWIISRFVKLSGAKLVLAAMWYYPILLLKHSFLRYDIGINFGLSDFDRNVGNALLYCLGVPRRVGSFGPNDKLLSDRVPVDSAWTHRAAAYLSFLRPLGILSANRNYEFPIGESDLQTVKLALRRENVDASKPLAVIHPGGKLHINSRRWPAEYYARVCDFLASSVGFEVVLTGDRDDEAVCDEIVSSPGTKVKSIAGRLTFSETAALLNSCQLCITNDTATLHLAEAVRVARVVSIFGPTDPDLLAPQNERNVVLRSHLPCAPCMGGLIDGNTERCWREVKEECMWGIKPEQVIGVLEQYYGKAELRLARA
jgi:ADP-heptose:LPS heptosyltransferase